MKNNMNNFTLDQRQWLKNSLLQYNWITKNNEQQSYVSFHFLRMFLFSFIVEYYYVYKRFILFVLSGIVETKKKW